MTTKHKPETPLTDAVVGDFNFPWSYQMEMLVRHAERIELDRAKLVEALRDLVKRCDGAEGVRADGSNIQTMLAGSVLFNLGEL